MNYETDGKSHVRHPVRRGKYKVHTEKALNDNQQKKLVHERQEEDDLVDEASEESFPASDPPSWSPTSTGGSGKRDNE